MTSQPDRVNLKNGNDLRSVLQAVLFAETKLNQGKIKQIAKKSNFSATIFSKIDALAQFRFDMLSLTNLLNYLIVP